MPSFRQLKDLQKQSLIIRPEEAEENRIASENARAQATLDLLAVVQENEANLFRVMLASAIQADGLAAVDVAKLETKAKEINDARERKKWLEVAQALAEIGIKQTGKGQRHMVWAAKRVGIDLVPLGAVPLTTATAPKLVTEG